MSRERAGARKATKQPAKKSPPRKRTPKGDAPDPSVRTARNTRRWLKTGTVEEIDALFPVTAPTQPVNGPDLNVPAMTPDPLPGGRPVIRYEDKDVELARRMIRATGIVVFIVAVLAKTKLKPGRTSRVTVEALLVAMWLAAQSERPMLLTVFTDILFRGISPSMRRLLDVPGGVNPRVDHVSPQRLRWNKSAANAVGRTFKKMTDLLDPSDEVAQRANVAWADMKFRGLTDEQAMTLQLTLDWVCNQLIQVTYDTLPERVRRFDNGDRCIDASPVTMPSTPRGIDNPQAMSMPHAAIYARDGDHRDPDEAKPPSGGKRRRKKSVSCPALDLHTLTMSDTTPGPWQRLPGGLVTTMTMDIPGADPAGNARRLLKSEKDRGFKPGYLTGDGLYAKAEETTFQIPARRLGWKLILPLTSETVGVQGSHESGLLWHNGCPTCPAIPPHLRTAVEDYRAGRIDRATYEANMRAVKKFQMVTKQHADQNGIGERVGCRAANHSLTVKCPHKPASMEERLTLDRDGNLADNRPTIFLPLATLTNGQPPTICQVQAVTLKETDAAKYRQAIPGGTDEHTDIYNALRQPQEGMHGFAKDQAKEALAASGRRRVRTKVAQQLFAAFLVAAANTRKIISFFEHALVDKQGDYYVVRTPRKGDHARTGLPPGTAPPGEPDAA